MLKQALSEGIEGSGSMGTLLMEAMSAVDDFEYFVIFMRAVVADKAKREGGEEDLDVRSSLELDYRRKAFASEQDDPAYGGSRDYYGESIEDQLNDIEGGCRRK